MLLDVAHGGVDLCADVGGFGQRQQIVEAGFGGQIKHALGVIGGGVVHARAAPGRSGGFFQLGALGGEADFGKAQKDEAEDGLRSIALAS